MRKKLKKFTDNRSGFYATFEREGVYLCNHVWFKETKGLLNLDLEKGDIVYFEARTKEYLKGYFGRREDVYKEISTDYKFYYPTKFKIVEKFTQCNIVTIGAIV